jgi:N-carbamoyl-L-amino-acid hydrolase
VVAALLLVAKAREKPCSLPLVGLGLRGEESAWFGTPYLGSKALLGKLHPRDLDRQRRPVDNEEGLPLHDYMERLSILWPRLVNGSPLVTPSQVAEFWELHIEQGPLLAARNKPIGVVTGIRGNVRAPRARVTGRADHSGTTPHDLRHDAVVRFAEIMTKLEEQRRALAALGDDLVFTCGIVGTNSKKHSITTIADEVNLALEVRSMDDTSARDFLAYAGSQGMDLGEVITTPAVPLSSPTWKRVVRACEGLEIPHEVMPSGAGHDAAVFQESGIPSGMIFVRNTNGSHNPAEAMDMGDFLLGCEVLWRTIVGDMS